MDRKRKPGIYLLTDAGDAVELILVWLDGGRRACGDSHPPRSWSPS